MNKLTYQILNLPDKRNRKRRTKPKVSKRKEIIKIREEINKIEILRKQYKRSIKPRAGFLKI